MTGARYVIVTAAYKLGPRLLKRPLSGTFVSSTGTLGRGTILGAVLFGLGWGISGVCPGAALASVGIGNYPIFLALGGMFLGAYVQGRFLEKPA